MYSLQRILAGAALLAAMSPAAHAVELFTAPVTNTGGNQIVCSIVNAGTKPIEVSATPRKTVDGSDLSLGAGCPASPATLAPGAGCLTLASTGNSGYCHFTATSSKVRAALLIRNGADVSDILSTLPATK